MSPSPPLPPSIQTSRPAHALRGPGDAFHGVRHVARRAGAMYRELLIALAHLVWGPRSAARRHVILFLAANPSETTRLALDEECAAIERELRMTTGRDDFDFRSRWAVSVDEVM